MKRLILAAALAAVTACGEGEAMNVEKATFAGGCFWCVEAPLEQLPGVKSVESGYTGGHTENPTYEQVCSGTTGHLEAVQVTFDPNVIAYEKLVDAFWRLFDPTDAGGSFYDRGKQYSSAIYYHSEAQREIAEASKKALAESGRFKKPIVTPILPAEKFWPAEDYHQDYYEKNPVRYTQYKRGSGREAFIEQHWSDEKETPMAGDTMAKTYSKPSDAELKEMLSPLQYKVTQKDGTEPAFRNEYWDNKKEGIYVDVVSGEPLFSSTHKYKSGTGWPSFWQPLVEENVVTKRDFKMIIPRTEVRSKHGDSHLGHVFNDGPEPTGMRYCMNSAALRFVPKEDLEKEGYGEFLELFEK